MPRCSSLVFILIHFLWVLDVWFSVWHWLEEIVIIVLNISSVSFFLILLILPLLVCYTSCSCPMVLGYSVCFQYFFFFLFFSFGGVYWDILKLGDPFSYIFSLLINSSKSFFVFFISGICFWFFLKIFIPLLTLPIYSCMLFTLSVQPLAY